MKHLRQLKKGHFAHGLEVTIMAHCFALLVRQDIMVGVWDGANHKRGQKEPGYHSPHPGWGIPDDLMISHWAPPPKLPHHLPILWPFNKVFNTWVFGAHVQIIVLAIRHGMPMKYLICTPLQIADLDSWNLLRLLIVHATNIPVSIYHHANLFLFYSNVIC
jgi:hypothetical protein